MKRRGIVSGVGVMVTLLLTGCGMHPLYGSSADGSGVSDELAAISIPAPANRLEQLIRNQLVSELYPAGASTSGKYKLTLVPTGTQPTEITYPEPKTDRFTYQLAVRYMLTDASSGKELTAGTARSFVSYDRVRQPVADIQSVADAESRAVHEVTGDIRLRLAAYFARG